jgi:glycerophosphoryl diester phosphodiesterase
MTEAVRNGFEILAHRGIHQDFSGKSVENYVCTARRIFEPEHSYIENTMASIDRAFELGATIVEVDVNRTREGELVLFHDAGLECRTNGAGRTSDHPLEYLRSLDVGYGYSPDNGKTFPLRGKGVGRMPLLREVLEKYPEKRFILDHKDESPETAERLGALIASLPGEQQEKLYYWGPGETLKIIQKQVPGFYRLIPEPIKMRRWMYRYILTLGLAGFPKEVSRKMLVLPIKYIKIIPGWPGRLLKKVKKAGGRLLVYVDTEDETRKIKGLPIDGIVTDHLDRIFYLFTCIKGG